MGRDSGSVLVGMLLCACSGAEEGDEKVVAQSDPAVTEVVRKVLREVPLIDGHNDVPWQYQKRAQNHLAEIDFASDLSRLDPPMHTDIPRLRAGGVGAQFWSVYTSTNTGGPGAARHVLEQIDVVHRLIERYPDHLGIAYGTEDIRRLHAQGKIASLIGMEGGHCLENSLAVLRQLYRAGARYLTLTHSQNTDWADSCSDAPRFDGLSAFGEEVVREMNRLGMLVDLSHVSPATMHDTLDVSEAPVIFSHSSARALCGHVRNVPDDVLARLRTKDGVVMVTFVPSFVSERVRLHSEARDAEGARLRESHPDQEDKVRQELAAWDHANPEPVAHLRDVADHVDHVREVAGIERVGIGSDFDGFTTVPEGLEDVSRFPALLAELERRGYGEEDLRKISGENLLRVFARVEQVAARLREERPASDLLFEESKEKGGE